MAIEISITNEADLYLSRNPIMVRVITDNVISTPGAQDHKRIRFVDEPDTAGDTIHFVCGDLFDVTFTAVGSTVNEGADEFKLRDTDNQTLAEWLLYLIQRLMTNDELARYYEFSRTASNTIAMKAYTSSSDIITTVTASGFAPEIQVMADGQTADFLDKKIGVRVCMTDNQIGFATNMTIRKGKWMHFDFTQYGEDGLIEVDVSEMVNSMFEDVEFAEYPDNIGLLVGGWCKSFYIEAAEYDVSRAEYKNGYTTRFYNVLKGGSTQQDKSVELDTRFWLSNKFLTNRRDEVVSHIDVIDFLYLVEPGGAPDGASVRINVQSVDVDNGIQNIIVYDEPAVRAGTVYQIPIGFMQVGMDSLIGPAAPYKMEITAEYHTGGTVHAVIGEKFTVYYAQESFVHGSMVYLNSFGLPEGQYLNGEVMLETKTDKDIFRRSLDGVPRLDQHVDLVRNVNAQQALTVTTGAMFDHQARGSYDILTSRRAWWRNLLAPDQKFIACQVDAGTVEIATVTFDGNTYAGYKFQLVFPVAMDMSAFITNYSSE